MSSVTEIAQQLKNEDKSIILIYAFNATGKTRLSVEYKNITKDPESGEHAGVYYNAFSEDLFVWDNDEENNNANVVLKVLWSSLSRYHSFLTPELVREKLSPYHPKYQFKFNLHENPEDGIASILFFIEDEAQPIKISRGEERIFVWCFFLGLFESGDWTNVQNAHFFIDDPVSSLDEHNIFITADTIFDLIENNYERKKVIITTHHIGLFSILADRLKRGEKSERYVNLTKLFVLSNSNNELNLSSPNNDVFIFHLHLMQVLDEAVKVGLFVYHFVLLRQLLETINSFSGRPGIGFALSHIGTKNPEEAGNMINSLSHKNAYRLQFNKMSPNEEDIFREIFEKIGNTYKFKY